MNTLHPTIASAINPFFKVQPLSIRHLIDPASFNDDDLYVYESDTLELVEHVSHCFQSVRDARHIGYRVKSGQSWSKGLCGKYLGLWSAA